MRADASGERIANRLLQQSAAAAATDLQQQLQQEFERRQQAFEQARASAVQQLESLEQRAEHLTSLVDVELQKHADGGVEEAVSEATTRLDAAGEKVRQAHVERAQAEMKALLNERLKQDTDELLRSPRPRNSSKGKPNGPGASSLLAPSRS